LVLVAAYGSMYDLVFNDYHLRRIQGSKGHQKHAEPPRRESSLAAMSRRGELCTSTPGRICLFGEHQDYLLLRVVPAAISLRIVIEGRRRNDSMVNIELPDIRSSESFSLNANLTYTKAKDYFKSAVNVLRRYGFSFMRGFDCVVRSGIPIQAGTSSSSALVVGWINFLAQMSDQCAQLSANDIARYAHQAEVLEFNEAGGMMDQFSTAYGGVIAIDFQPDVHVERIKCRLGSFVLGDSLEAKDTQGILSRVKGGVERIADSLKGLSLRAATSVDIGKLRSQLSADEFRLLAGTVRNHEITQEARTRLNQAPLDHERIGALLNEHQSILRDVLKISTHKIDRMLDAALNAGALGGKINGSGGGGCMFAYAPENAERVAEAIERAGGKAYIVSVDEGTRVEQMGGTPE
jgi:galactokinase